MENVTKSFKNRYLPFIITLVFITISVLFVIQRSISFQKQDAFLINKSGKQRTLSQTIAKIAFSIDTELNDTLKLHSLRVATDELESTHTFLKTNASENKNSRAIDSLLKGSEVSLNRIITSSRNISDLPKAEHFEKELKNIAEVEPIFLSMMDSLAYEYQKQLELKLQDLNLIIYFLVFLSLLLLVGEYFLVITPSFREVYQKNKELTEVNEDLSISENKLSLSQLALNKAHTELKAMLNSGAIAIVSTDTKGVINHFNSGAEILLGYAASEMVGLQEPEIFHIQEELDKFRIEIAERYGVDPEGFDPYVKLAKEDEHDTREWTYRRKDGSTFPVELTLTAIKNTEGEKIGFLGVSFDITERKKAKDELLKKNQLLNFAEEITLIGHWQWDTIADKVQWSDNLYNIFELDRNTIDLNFNTYFNYVHSDDKELVTKYFEAALNGNGFTSFTHRISTHDRTKVIQLLGEVLTNDKGEVIELIGTCQDITQQRMAENKFRGLLESAPDAMVIVNEKGKIQLINRQAELLFGYSALELQDKPVETLIPKRFISGHGVYREHFFTNPKVRGMGVGKDLFGKHKNGKEVPIQISLSPIQTEEGLLVSAAIRDITIQKIAENELLRKNQILNFAEKITLMGNWQADIVNSRMKWSDNLYRIFNLDVSVNPTLETYLSFTHPDDKGIVAEHMRNTSEEKKFTDITHRIQLSDGTVKNVQLLAQVIKDNQGNVIEIIGTCQDVTQQKMAENKFRGLLESAPDAMVIVNGQGQIQLINKQAEKLFGYTLEELFGKLVETLIPQRFTGNYKHKAHRDGFFSSPKVHAYGVGDGKELFGINKEGKEIPIQISLSPLETEEGLLVSAAIRDITEQKLAQNKILQAKDNLEVLTAHLTGQNKQLEDFAHITSHNLRSPVSNLNALLHLYDISESEEDRKLLFEKFEIVIEHLTSTLNTLIEALKTKKEGGKSIEMLDFEEVLNKTKEIISGQIIKTNATITSDFSKIPKIEYHKTYLDSIFLNLVTNAIKYRSPDRAPEIHIETEFSNKKIKISFRDNGLGIDLEKHGHKLFGLNKTFHRHPEAKGVGLYLTKIQVDSMGGSIYATSEVNKGSVFTIIFNENTNE